MVNVAIFDYGAGNIFSLKTSLEKNGANVDIITSFDQSKKYAHIDKSLYVVFRNQKGFLSVLEKRIGHMCSKACVRCAFRRNREIRNHNTCSRVCNSQ